MKFAHPLTPGVLIQRYKRFFADVQLSDGRCVVAHCPNSGSMLGVKEPGSKVWLSATQGPKLAWRWEIIEIGNSKVGINTLLPNRIVVEALDEKKIPELIGYDSVRREVAYGTNSRVDLLLTGSVMCFVEIKNVTLRRGDRAEFPDAVTERGTKHLRELAQETRKGNRAVMIYIVQRTDCKQFSIAADIDPVYAKTFEAATKAGVEALCYQCIIKETEITLDKALPVGL